MGRRVLALVGGSCFSCRLPLDLPGCCARLLLPPACPELPQLPQLPQLPHLLHLPHLLLLAGAAARGLCTASACCAAALVLRLTFLLLPVVTAHCPALCLLPPPCLQPWRLPPHLHASV